MSKRIGKSAKGEEVDFDLLETKQKMQENKPRAMEVKQREDFVHTKRKSRGKRSVMRRLRERRNVENKNRPQSKSTKKPETENKQQKTPTTEKKKSTKKKTRKIVKNDKD
jgi:hypothetical protein